MKTKKRLQIGDVVKIVNPEVFVRCGYPLSPLSDNVRAKSESLADDLEEFVGKCITKMDANEPKPEESKPIKLLLNTNRMQSGFDKILKEMCYFYCIHKKFGGNVRSVHTARIPQLEGKRFKVVGYKSCYSGVRSPGVYSSWDGEYDPPFLGSTKYHHILLLERYDDLTVDEWEVFDAYSIKNGWGGRIFSEQRLPIEDIHVQKVENPKSIKNGVMQIV